MFEIVRWARNAVEDLLHPRPRFEVEINGRKVEGRALVIGQQRDLTASGAYASVAALQAAAASGVEPSPADLVGHLDGLISIAAAGMRRSRRWIERHVTSEELGRIVSATVAASNPKPKEGAKGPPAPSPS